MSRRNVTDEAPDPRERYRLYRLCGDRDLQIVATCPTPEAVGLAIVTLAREDEFVDCPAIGILDTMGEPGHKWLVKPWGPYPTEASVAGRVLASARKGKT